MRTAQTDSILAHLKTGGCVDPITALKKFGCNRLAARIRELREAGYEIETKMTKVRTRAGTTRVAVYRMAPCDLVLFRRAA